MNGGGIDVQGHFTAEGIDFPDQVTFGETADGRVAGHRPDGVGIDHRQQRFAAQPGGGQGRFTAGVAGTDHGDIKGVEVVHDGLVPRLADGCQEISAQRCGAKPPSVTVSVVLETIREARNVLSRCSSSPVIFLIIQRYRSRA